MGAVTHVEISQVKIFKTVGATSSMKWAEKCQNDPIKGKGGVKINRNKSEEDG